MARQARQKSSSGIYHIVLRGINRQIIFEDDEDKEKFLETLHYYKSTCHCTIYGYCLMDNHIHLLIKEENHDIAGIMKRIGVRFVAWYNRKYRRCGHLFQDRFISEVVENDEYLLTVLRYIHQNPIKSSVVCEPGNYKWDSYNEYIDKQKLVDTDFILGSFSAERKTAITRFREFMDNTTNEICCIEDKTKVSLTDQEAKLAIQKCVDVMTPTELQAMEKVMRDYCLKRIKEIPGISTWQIARLTGISQSVVTRA